MNSVVLGAAKNYTNMELLRNSINSNNLFPDPLFKIDLAYLFSSVIGVSKNSALIDNYPSIQFSVSTSRYTKNDIAVLSNKTYKYSLKASATAYNFRLFYFLYDSSNNQVGSGAIDFTNGGYKKVIFTTTTNTAFVKLGINNLSTTDVLNISQIFLGIPNENFYSIPKGSNQLLGKKILGTGDSITAGTSWLTKVANRNYMDLTNYATAGGSIVYTDGRFDIGASIDTMISENLTTDYILLSGGYNDSQTTVNNPLGTTDNNEFDGTYITTTILGELDSMCYKLLSAYPKVKIGFVLTYRVIATYWDTNREAMKNVLKKWGIPYCDLSVVGNIISNTGISALDVQFKDGLHPTDETHEKIADIVEAWLKTI